MVRLSRRLPDPQQHPPAPGRALAVFAHMSVSITRIYTRAFYFPSSLSCPSLLWHTECPKHCWTDKWRESIRKLYRGNDIDVVPRMFFLLQRNRIAAVTFSWVPRGLWWAWQLKRHSPVEEVPRGLEYPRCVTVTAHSQGSHSGSQSFLSVLKDSFYKTPYLQGGHWEEKTQMIKYLESWWSRTNAYKRLTGIQNCF